MSAVTDNLAFFRSIRHTTLFLVSGLSQSRMDFAPAPAKWSVGEVLDHLWLADRIYQKEINTLIAMKQAGQRPVITRTFAEMNTTIAFVPKTIVPYLDVPFTLFNMLIPNAVREVMTQVRLIPARHPDIATPTKGKPADALRAALRESWQDTEALFVNHPDLDYEHMYYQHPMIGRNTIPQLLRFLALHEQRHQGQIKAVLRSPRYPAS